MESISLKTSVSGVVGEMGIFHQQLCRNANEGRFEEYPVAASVQEIHP